MNIITGANTINKERRHAYYCSLIPTELKPLLSTNWYIRKPKALFTKRAILLLSALLSPGIVIIINKQMKATKSNYVIVFCSLNPQRDNYMF